MGTQTPELKIIDLYSIYFGAPKTFHIFGTCPIVEGEGKERRLARKWRREGGKESHRERVVTKSKYQSEHMSRKCGFCLNLSSKKSTWKRFLNNADVKRLRG